MPPFGHPPTRAGPVPDQADGRGGALWGAALFGETWRQKSLAKFSPVGYNVTRMGVFLLSRSKTHGKSAGAVFGVPKYSGPIFGPPPPVSVWKRGHWRVYNFHIMEYMVTRSDFL